MNKVSRHIACLLCAFLCTIASTSHARSCPGDAASSLELTATFRPGRHTYGGAIIVIDLTNRSKKAFYVYDSLALGDCLYEQLLTWDGQATQLRSRTRDFADVGAEGYHRLGPGEKWTVHLTWSDYFRDDKTGIGHFKLRFLFAYDKNAHEARLVKPKRGESIWSGTLRSNPVAVTLEKGYVTFGLYQDFQDK